MSLGGYLVTLGSRGPCEWAVKVAGDDTRLLVPKRSLSSAVRPLEAEGRRGPGARSCCGLRGLGVQGLWMPCRGYMQMLGVQGVGGAAEALQGFMQMPEAAGAGGQGPGAVDALQGLHADAGGQEGRRGRRDRGPGAMDALQGVHRCWGPGGALQGYTQMPGAAGVTGARGPGVVDALQGYMQMPGSGGYPSGVYADARVCLPQAQTEEGAQASVEEGLSRRSRLGARPAQRSDPKGTV